MAAAISEKSEWPSIPISSAVKELINRFYVIVNDKSDNGRRLRDEVFTPDGTWKSPGRAYNGAEFVGATANSWAGINYRVHEVVKVYSGSEAGDDLMMFGKATYGLENGATVETDFSARCVIDDPKSSTPRLRLFQGYTVRVVRNTLLASSMYEKALIEQRLVVLG